MNRLFLLITAALTLSCMVYTCKDIPPGPDNDKPDTTSHNFTWETFLLGDGSGSFLHDVAIINDTLAYAVGEIHLRDSSGNWKNPPYNVARWNGREWELITLKFNCRLYYPYCGPDTLLFGLINAVFAFNANDIWFGPHFHWDGESFKQIPIYPYIFDGVGVNKMWGNADGLYVVGNNGFIARRNVNGTWRKLESGTTLRIFDIWGSWSKQLNRWEILAIASSTQSSENALLQILPTNTVVSMNVNGLSSFSNGIWFVPQKRYYVVGSGIHQKASLGEATWNIYAPGEVTSYASSAIYGQSVNDMFIAGSFLEVVHYNGSTWYNYKNEIPFADGVFADVDMKGNTVILVGQLNQQAIILIGRR